MVRQSPVCKRENNRERKKCKTLLFDKMRNKEREEDHQKYDQVSETYREMVEKIEKGDFQEALRLAQMLKKQGADQEYWAMQMSIAYLGLGKTANAKSCIEPLYREYPDELTFSVQRAVCLYEDGEFFEAEKTLERIYPPDTYLPFYYSTYGDVLENQGKSDFVCPLSGNRKISSAFFKAGRWIAENGIYGKPDL